MENFARVSEGVKGRVIVPRSNNPTGKLHFQEHYTPHTRPGGKWGGSGARSGDWITARSTNWPGIKARKFNEIIGQKREREVFLTVYRILKDAYSK